MAIRAVVSKKEAPGVPVEELVLAEMIQVMEALHLKATTGELYGEGSVCAVGALQKSRRKGGLEESMGSIVSGNDGDDYCTFDAFHPSEDIKWWDVGRTFQNIFAE